MVQRRFSDRSSVPGHGFTLLEVLVVVSVIGLLAALLLPAVQSARGAARRSYCASNLRSIGLALASYESVHGVFPGGSNGYGYSLHVMLLPHVEQQPLYASLNFDTGADRIYEDSPNRTAYLQKVAVFSCPDQTLPAGFNGTSYAGNRGVGERIMPQSGVFTSGSAIASSRYIPDGKSQTIAVSEWVNGPMDLKVRDAKGSVFATTGKLIGESNVGPFLAECSQINPSTSEINQNDKGLNWLLGGYRHTLYNHSMNVNQYSCVSAGMAMEGAYTASSRHNNGLNSLFGDGHCQFMNNTISLKVWRALGTRSGAEVITP